MVSAALAAHLGLAHTSLALLLPLRAASGLNPFIHRRF
jgi:hypothetical protein